MRYLHTSMHAALLLGLLAAAIPEDAYAAASNAPCTTAYCRKRKAERLAALAKTHSDLEAKKREKAASIEQSAKDLQAQIDGCPPTSAMCQSFKKQLQAELDRSKAVLADAERESRKADRLEARSKGNEDKANAILDARAERLRGKAEAADDVADAKKDRSEDLAKRAEAKRKEAADLKEKLAALDADGDPQTTAQLRKAYEDQIKKDEKEAARLEGRSAEVGEAAAKAEIAAQAKAAALNERADAAAGHLTLHVQRQVASLEKKAEDRVDALEHREKNQAQAKAEAESQSEARRKKAATATESAAAERKEIARLKAELASFPPGSNSAKYIQSLIDQREAGAATFDNQATSFTAAAGRSDQRAAELQAKIDAEKQKAIDVAAAAEAKKQRLYARDQD